MKNVKSMLSKINGKLILEIAGVVAFILTMVYCVSNC